PQGQILEDKLSLDWVFADDWQFTYRFTPSSDAMLRDNLSMMYNEGNKAIGDTESSNVFTNLYNEAFSALQDATEDPLIKITKAQNFMNSVCYFPLNVSTRLGILTNSFNGLSTALLTRSEKQVYENNASMILSAMTVVAATPQPGNYTSRVQVITVMDQLLAAYNAYLAALDALQSQSNS